MFWRRKRHHFFLKRHFFDEIEKCRSGAEKGIILWKPYKCWRGKGFINLEIRISVIFGVKLGIKIHSETVFFDYSTKWREKWHHFPWSAWKSRSRKSENCVKMVSFSSIWGLILMIEENGAEKGIIFCSALFWRRIRYQNLTKFSFLWSFWKFCGW